jgi:hypothetical protein
MEACYGGTDVMERSCAVARGIDINTAGSFASLALRLALLCCGHIRPKAPCCYLFTIHNISGLDGVWTLLGS